MAVIIISCAILFFALAMLSISRQKSFLEQHANNFTDTVNEAKQVQQDLTELMNNVVTLSENMVNIMTAEDKEQIICSEHPVEKVRVYQLAREMGISSSYLVQKLNSAGLNINNHMNCVDRELVKQILQNNTNTNINQVMKFPTENKKENTAANQDNSNELKKSSGEFTIEKLKTAHPYIAVRTLKEQGYSVKDIAKILGRGQGEINLILNLSRKTNAV